MRTACLGVDGSFLGRPRRFGAGWVGSVVWVGSGGWVGSGASSEASSVASSGGSSVTSSGALLTFPAPTIVQLALKRPFYIEKIF